MAADALDSALEDLLYLIVGVCTQVLMLLLKEVQVAFPYIDLRSVVAERALVDFLSLADGLSRVGVILAALHEKRGVVCHIRRVDWVFVADLFQHLHVLLVAERALTSL